MGFSVIATQILLITVVIITLGTYLMIYGYQSNSYSEASQKRADIRYKKVANAIDISSITYNYTTKLLEVQLLNKGPDGFFEEDITTYIDNTYIARDNSNRSTVILVDTGNQNYVDAGETVRVRHTHWLNPGTYGFIATTPSGAQAQSDFQVVIS